ncbi:MAG: TIGR04283 family arsenosugar biosynthesis glycosyltransferase [Phycisphaeraceae bacterium]
MDEPLDTSRQRLLVFARFPEAGKTKTRLIPALGAEGAANLHAQMIRRSMHTASRLSCTTVELHHDGGTARNWHTLLRRAANLRPQSEGDLGTRMRTAFDRSFTRGDKAVVVIGTDCPFLQRRDLSEAFDHLRRHDMVIGPAADGGYYLLGLRRLVPRVFENIDWGGADVLAQTLARAADAGLSVMRMCVLRDIDTPDDLAAFASGRSSQLSIERPPYLSVIIAARNEEQHIAATIASARDRSDAQIIVVDGGSQDRTCEITRAMGAQVLESPAGRAAQMNLGASKATGKVLVFLHGDTTLPPGYAAQVRSVLRRSGTIAGGFRLHIDGGERRFRLIEFMANLRSRTVGLPYGDQALFVCRDRFHALGEFSDMPVMEDYEWIRRARKHGRIGIASASVTTSARRWRQRGAFRLTVAHQAMIVGYHLGASPTRLASWR